MTAIPVSPLRRSEILRFASALVHPDDREPHTVTGVARTLLDWTAEAPDDGDQKARMKALGQANCNLPVRNPYPDNYTAAPRMYPLEQFLGQVKAYHQFITED